MPSGKKQWWDPQPTESQPLPNLTIPQYPVHEYIKEDWWQSTGLAEANPHLEWVRLTAENPDTTLVLDVQGLDSPEKRPPHPILLQHLPQYLPGDPVICLLQIHKAHVDRMGILPGPLQQPCESKELVHFSTTRAESVWFLFNLTKANNLQNSIGHTLLSSTLEWT